MRQSETAWFDETNRKQNRAVIDYDNLKEDL